MLTWHSSDSTGSNIMVFVSILLFVPIFSCSRKWKCIFAINWRLLNFVVDADPLGLDSVTMEWRGIIVGSRRLKKVTDGFCSRHCFGVNVYAVVARATTLSDLVVWIWQAWRWWALTSSLAAVPVVFAVLQRSQVSRKFGPVVVGIFACAHLEGESLFNYRLHSYLFYLPWTFRFCWYHCFCVAVHYFLRFVGFSSRKCSYNWFWWTIPGSSLAVTTMFSGWGWDRPGSMV